MLKKKIKNSIILILLVIASSAMAQEIYVGTGFSSASFEDYVNSSGENTLNDSGYSKPKEPLFESGVLFNIYKEKLKFDTGLYYAKYKINTSFYSGNITWGPAPVQTNFFRHVLNDSQTGQETGCEAAAVYHRFPANC